MMEGVKRGGDRQELHEIIRTCSMAATARMKEGESCDLMERLAEEPAFALSKEELQQVLAPELYIGRSAEQVELFLQKIRPLFVDCKREKTEIDL